MITLPFQHTGPTRDPEPQYYQWNDPDLASENSDRGEDQSGADGPPARDSERFLPWVCLALALFAMAVFSVVREIQHNRELYRMSQQVTWAEAQRRQCLEALRMAEAREASLQAELQGRPFLTRNVQVMPASALKLN
jgi:hypothetical protein